jgi:hypothetical protein
VQGNSDHPLALLAGGSALDRFIFNLGHGILPQTPDRACGAGDRTRAPELDLERRLLTAIMTPS